MGNSKNKICSLVDVICIAWICLGLGSILNAPKALKQENEIVQYKEQITILGNSINGLTNKYDKLENDYEDIIDKYNMLQDEYEQLLTEYNSILNEKIILDENIVEKYVPANSGSIKTYMGYNQNWSKSTGQYRLHSDISSDVEYDKYGYATYDNRYFVAVKPYYGKAGDYIDVYQEDGSIIPCIIGDNKGNENSNKYIHFDGSIVEFMVGNKFKGVKQTRPEFCQNISMIKNLGNYFDFK